MLQHIFSQLGLPSESFIIALTLDVLFDFIASGVNAFYLQLTLLLEAKNVQELDRNILESNI